MKNVDIINEGITDITEGMPTEGMNVVMKLGIATLIVGGGYAIYRAIKRHNDKKDQQAVIYHEVSNESNEEVKVDETE